MNGETKSDMNYGYMLSALVEHAGKLREVRRTDLNTGDQVFVLTANSRYHVRVAEDGWYHVTGGWFDRKSSAPVRTRIAGCTWGGSALKVDIVAACGLCLEFGNRVTTSPVRKIIVIPRERQN